MNKPTVEQSQRPETECGHGVLKAKCDYCSGATIIWQTPSPVSSVEGIAREIVKKTIALLATQHPEIAYPEISMRTIITTVLTGCQRVPLSAGIEAIKERNEQRKVKAKDEAEQWATIGRIKIDIETETETFERTEKAHLPEHIIDIDTLLAALTGYEQWHPLDTIPRDGTTFRAYSPDLVHPDFNPWGSVEAVFDGEKFIGAVWDGQFDCWNTVEVSPTLWKPISDSPSYQRKQP